MLQYSKWENVDPYQRVNATKHFTLLEYTKASELAVFLDKRTNTEFKWGYNRFVEAVKLNPERDFSVDRSTDPYIQLEAFPNFELLNYVGGKKKSSFRDVRTGYTFELRFDKFIDSVRKDPNMDFSLRRGVHPAQRVAVASDNRYKLLTYTKADSLAEFEEIATGKTFWYQYSTFFYFLRQNSNYVFKGKSRLEQSLTHSLASMGVEFTTQQISSYKPDFIIEDHKLIIECDGLYWHSDIFKHKAYHREKLKAYEDLGYTALFFREDEINNSLPIVESIIKNHLNLSSKIYARKCTLGTTDKSFFEENHLMGKGSGKIFALLHNGEPVAAMQVKWTRKGSVLDISRFCTKKGTSVVGGFSRLLKAVEREHSPSVITNFVDRRYGQGSHLEKLGFNLVTDRLSFRWTKGPVTHHRMKFPGKSGYDQGYNRVWDCGQAKFEKRLNG